MNIQQIFFKNILRNFCYLITFDDGAIYCIDPFESDLVLKVLKNEKLKAIINTHDHCDHYSGNEKLVEKFHCTVMAHKDAQIPFKNGNLLNQQVIYQFGVWSLKSIYTPGHTMSHVCLLLEKENIPYALFTGDCFFNAGVGNCHNGGDPKVMYQTISKIFKTLPDQLLIYPGHEYLKRNLEFTKKQEPANKDAEKFLQMLEGFNLDETFFVNSMKVERQINTFLRLESSALRSQLHLVNADNEQVFLTLRELRNKW